MILGRGLRWKGWWWTWRVFVKGGRREEEWARVFLRCVELT